MSVKEEISKFIQNGNLRQQIPDLDNYYTYILYSPAYNRFYMGQCHAIAARIDRHNNGLVISTKPYIPWELIGFIEKPNRSEAMILKKSSKT